MFFLIFTKTGNANELTNVESLFDSKFYSKIYKVSEEDSLQHYLTEGHQKNNRPNAWFDPAYHLKELERQDTSKLPLSIFVEKVNNSLTQVLETKWDFTIVGAGFAGCTIANKLARSGFKVALFEKKPYIGGNCSDHYDEHGVLIHPYGPHIFHTNNKDVLEFLSEFTSWRFYEHRVKSVIDAKDGTLYPMPINRTTINMLYSLDLKTDEECRSYLESVKIPIAEENIQNSEDVVYSLVGKDLCDKFFRNYTHKQWERDLKDLDPSVLRRIPTRTNTDDRYFSDTYQMIPADGYSAMLRKMVDVPNLNLFVGFDYLKFKDKINSNHTIVTGPIDAYFNYCQGFLPYRSIHFEFEHHPLPVDKKFQQTGTINYPNDYEFTRITEFKWITGQKIEGTTILKEYPKESSADQEPFYPILCKENDEKLKAYRELADEEGVTCLGRLAEYKYYNMDQVVEAALKKANELKVRFQFLL